MYDRLKTNLASGWNTWNTRNVLSHVLLPDAFSVNICIKEYQVHRDRYLREALIGKKKKDDEHIFPGAHTYSGSYTSLILEWAGLEIQVESAVRGNDLFLLITPLKNQKFPATIIIEAGILWNHKGSVCRVEQSLVFSSENKTVHIYATGKNVEIKNAPFQTPYLAVELSQPIGICTSEKIGINEIMEAIVREKDAYERNKEKYGRFSELYDAMQSCLAWDTIYEPCKERVITPVSRLWNVAWGGYVLFCWDTYFTALMASLDNKELAYANFIEITREKTERGFVPNFAADGDCKSRDRSQPPVGSFCARLIYNRYEEKWFLEEVFDDLYKWNRWWLNNRVVKKGMLAWGSNPFEDKYGGICETEGVGDSVGAALESGLDNTPMYDNVPFNKEKGCLELADVGLTGLYILDCRSLSKIAEILGYMDKKEELDETAEEFSKGLLSLWDDRSGFYLNKRMDTNEWNRRISPTNFFALFSGKDSKGRIARIIDEHFYNSDEFWGEWIIPSTPRNDPAFPEQDYWRGRIWAPLNFLAYAAFKMNGCEKVCKDISDKSARLLLGEWSTHRHVYENYNAITGVGTGINSCDPFYSWGGLLSFIALCENGLFDIVQ